VTLYSSDDDNNDATLSDAVELIQQQICFDRCQPQGHCRRGTAFTDCQSIDAARLSLAQIKRHHFTFFFVTNE